MRTMNTRLLIVGTCLALGVAGGATACGGTDDAQPPPATPPTEGTTTTAATSARTVEEFQVDGAPTAIAAGDGAVWVVLDQGDRVARIDPGPARSSASRSPWATEPSESWPLQATSGS